MNILIIYGTYSTGTLRASELLQSFLAESGQNVTLKRVDTVQADDLQGNDLIVMASPSWKVFGKEGMPHEHYYPFMERVKGTVFDKPFAVMGLGDDSYAKVCGSADHLEGFVTELGGHLLLDSLRVEGFYFNEEKRTEEIKEWAEQIVQKLTS